MAFASRFLNDSEENYAPDELELLAVVWGVEYFKHYLTSRKFRLETDHKALVSVYNRESLNKDFSPRLIRWIHRLLPYEFDVMHRPGKTMGITDFLSISPKISEEEGEFDDGVFTIMLIEDLNKRKNETLKCRIFGKLLKIRREKRKNKAN